MDEKEGIGVGEKISGCNREGEVGTRLGCR